MGKKYIVAQRGGLARRLDCRDILKIYYIHKKSSPPLPRASEDERE